LIYFAIYLNLITYFVYNGIFAAANFFVDMKIVHIMSRGLLSNAFGELKIDVFLQ